MTDTTALLDTEWMKHVSVILILAAGYLYARFNYAPVIQELKNKINELQWQLHDLRNERDALQTKLELTQVQCDQMTDRAYSSAEENAMLHGIIRQRYSERDVSELP